MYAMLIWMCMHVDRCVCSVAVRANNVAALRFFVMAGADVNAAGLLDACLLHDSILARSYECTILLLAAGADVAARDCNGRTACFLAALEEPMPFVIAMVAAGADLDAEDENGETPRQFLTERGDDVFIDPLQVEAARREIAKVRIDFVRRRAMEVCIGLQSLQLDALQLCEILPLACGRLARLIAFHQWWKIATTVKHFKTQ
jgi:hypothetical protein